ncbi:MAG: rhamnulose-1-phosphate aldolase [Candidatus Gastranaerophilales bacterium]|nr:rhamnulose-1-phosphate aldolase [Candidatus Gastranaerophilales bacterium]
MNNIFGVRIIEEYVHMCHDGVRQGWHERNGGNLTYRMKPEEVTECRPYFRERPGDWVDIGVQAENLKGEYFISTGSGKFLQNVDFEPQNNICIVEINDTGDQYRIVWGLEKGGKPTSEFPTHFMNHSVRKRVTNDMNRVIYHAHTPYVIALTYVLPLQAEPFTRMLWKSATECCVVFPGGVGVVPWMVPGGPEIAKATCVLMEQYDAAVWAYHGLFVSGPDFDTAFGLMHTIEKAAQIASIAMAANGGRKLPHVITDDNLRQIGKDFGVTLNESILNYHSDDELFC